MGNRFREKVTEEGLDGTVENQIPSPQPEEKDGEHDEASQQAASQADDAAAEEQPKKRGRSDKMAKGVAKVLGGDILGDRFVLNQIRLLLLCLFFLLLLVANRYEVESLSREKMASLDRINDLREHRIQMQKQYQKSVKISQIAEELSESGVGITSGPPYEIEK